MNSNALAYYWGNAFCGAVNVQSMLNPGELLCPIVIHWRGEEPFGHSYPAETQEKAILKAIEARENQGPGFTGWSSVRDGRVELANGKKQDVLVVEAWVPGLDPSALLFHFYEPHPFKLIPGFNFQNHAQLPLQGSEQRKEFIAHFRRGINAHPFAAECLKALGEG